MDRNRIVETALGSPSDAIRRALTSEIRKEKPELFIVEVEDLYSLLYRFSGKGHCTLGKVPDFYNDNRMAVDRGQIRSTPDVSWWEIVWGEVRLEFVQVHVQNGFQRGDYSLMLSDVAGDVRRFLLRLAEFGSEIDGAVLVFQDGCWRYSEELFEEIQSCTLGNLVLPEGMASQIRNDVQSWLDSRGLYEQHGIPWKRGMILVGPPGNGKTHTIKALVNHFGLNALYVRGFSSEYGTDSQNISKVFEKARSCAPAMLILEDLDSLVNTENRSHFLNELDGFARNTGILAIASANNPAQLDPALVNRPSRFDRRYSFDLPELKERFRYLTEFTETLDPTLQLSAQDAEFVARRAEGFSYAYLKELVLSGMMAWISSGRSEPFASVLSGHVGPLKAQMEIDPEPTPTAALEGPEALKKKQMAAFRRKMKM